MDDAAIPTAAKAKPFHFKRPRPADLHDNDDDFPSQKHASRARFETYHPHRHRHHRRHHHHHRSNRSQPDDSASHMPREPSPVEPLTAFREALFDALADDEGAEYWSHVYGQPLDAWPRADVERQYGGAVGDDDYAKYVREQMWERSHGHIIEERERRARQAQMAREAEKLRERKDRKRWEEEKEWRRAMEKRVRKREEKEEGRRWEEAWERYGRSWEDVLLKRKEEQGSDGNSDSGKSVEQKKCDTRGRIPWPVESGKAKHVSKDAVELFFRNALSSSDFTTKSVSLRAERVRWHPDKIRHHFGGQTIDDETMKLVNSVFLVVDALYNDSKGKD
ncbi:MAG: hypothetical protein M1821_001590 [Bathelium mastoideum]|nr:MAG: hypothetical protein M1821_001590 [Bathelium mastoideum]